ncbi:MAG: FtsX-like permease family protein [Pseudomonadota bacterium]
MEIRPILSTLLRNKTGAILIALQIALTMAVVINAAFVIQDRRDTMAKTTGVDDSSLILARALQTDRDIDVRSIVERDTAALMAIDGVQQVSKISTVPLSNSGSSQTFSKSAELEDGSWFNLAYYQTDAVATETLGLEITRGRWFRDDEIVYNPADGEVPRVKVLSDAVADEVFEGEDPIGKFIYTSRGDAIEIIGTIASVGRPWYNWGELYATSFTPFVEINYMYAIRTAPEDRDRLIPIIEETLVELDTDRLVGEPRTHSEVIARTYSRDVAMNRMLTIVMALVVSITALGIVGLASFSVAQRRRQIGTRRAVGARRHHILSYFLVENWLITTGGIVLGLALSFGLNYWLVTKYTLPKLDPVALPLVVLGLWAVGLLAAAGPARKATGIDPAIATRTV